MTEAIRFANSPSWRDNHPNRYGRLRNGDWCVMAGFADGFRHFVRVYNPPKYKDDIWLWNRGIAPGGASACGVPVPQWRDEPTRYPLGGVVNCAGCLAAMREAS
jgi:hypothetical protein